MNTILTKLKSVGYEVLFAFASVFILIGALIPILILFPTSVTVDIGGELHLMLKGVVVGFSSLALTVVTHWVGFKTHWAYAVLSGGDKDPDNKLPSYTEDFQSADTAPKRFRVIVFTISFFVVWILWFNAITPDAVIVQ